MISISFFSEEQSDNFISKGLFNTPKELSKIQYIDVSEDCLKDEINKAINKIGNIVYNNENSVNGFEIDEIEFGLNIGMDGKVSLIALESTASMQTSIKIKLKRCEKNER